MTPNTEMINKLIDHLRKVGGDHFYMSKFATRAGAKIPYVVNKYKPCQTAFCVAGWVNALSVPEDELASMDSSDFEGLINSASNASRLLNLSDDDADKLFYMEGTRTVRMEPFDQLPHNYRLDAAVRVLELLRDKHIVDWDRAVRETVPQPVYYEAYCGIFGYPDSETAREKYDLHA